MRTLKQRKRLFTASAFTFAKSLKGKTMNTSKENVLFTIRLPDITGYARAESIAAFAIDTQNDYAWQIAHEGIANGAAIPENVQNALDEYQAQNEDFDWSKYAYALRKMFASDFLYAMLEYKNYYSNNETKERVFPEWRACEDWIYIDIPESAKPYLHHWLIAAMEEESDVISELAMLFFVADNPCYLLPETPEELADYLELEKEPFPDCSENSAPNLHYDYFEESTIRWIEGAVDYDLIEQCNANKAALFELYDVLVKAKEESL
jgi:hypothetical protein|nr:MAG TPA: hypothetical protein [Caudoviricetes sp.]